MTFIPTLENTVSTTNSSTTPLGISSVFTGAGVDTGEYSTITVSAFSDQAGILSIQFSSDNTNWDIINNHTITANTGFTETTNIGARYFRIVFTNGSVAQTTLRLQSMLTTGKSPDDEDFTGLTSFKTVSTLNSSTTPLTGAATFTGTGETTIYNTLITSCTADAAGTLFVDYSPDGIVWQSSSFSGYRVEASVPMVIKEAIKNTYFRVRLVNGSVAQTSLNLVSIVGAFEEEFLTSIEQIIRKNVGLEPDANLFINVAYADALTTSYQDVWGTTGIMTLPAAAESYEIVSSNANDTAAGTGARIVFVETLDANGLAQSQIVTLNGTTPVALAGTHAFPRVQIVASSGSNLTNLGNITLRVAGGGATRSIVPIDFGKSLDSHYKVPSNTEFHITGLDYHTGIASKLITARSRVFLPGTNTWVSTSVLPFASQSFTRDFDEASARFQPGTIIKYDAKVSTGSGDAISIILAGIERRIS